MEKVLRYHAQKYPMMQPIDAVKLLYQNEFGGGHMIADEQACLERLAREYDGVEADDKPLFEPIGNGFCRVNLSGVKKQNYPLSQVGQAFLQSAAVHHGSLPAFLEKLELLRELTREGIFGFTAAELEGYLAAYEKAGYPPVSHSQVYREAYHPAYRVILETRKEQAHEP